MHLGHFPAEPIPLCVVVWSLIAASTDITARRIPNWLVLSGLLAALAVRVWLAGFLPGGGAWLGGAAAGFALFLPFYLLRGMAAGDVKLLCMVGAWVGAELALDIALATFLIGAVWSLALVLARGRLRQLLVNLNLIAGMRGRAAIEPATADAVKLNSVGSIPYGVAVAAAVIGILAAVAA